MTYWRSVNADHDPELKQAVLDGSLNVLECECGQHTPIHTDLLYHDMEGMYQVHLVLPGKDGVIDLNGIALKLGASVPGYRLRIVRSRHSLLEKVLLFDDRLDDRAIEVLKQVITPMLSKASPSRLREIRCTGIESGEGNAPELGFLVFRDDQVGPDAFAFSLEQYTDILTALQHHCPQQMAVATRWLLVEEEFGVMLLEKWREAEGDAEPDETPPAKVPGVTGPHAQAPARATTASTPKLAGVRGWLLLLCVMLVLVGPMMNLGALSIAAETYAPFLTSYPRLSTTSSITNALTIVYVIHSMGVGGVLWARQAGAVRAAKIFFILSPVYTLAGNMAPMAAQLPPAADAAIIEGAVQGLVRAVLWSTVWFVYLVRSRRVRATYLR